MRYSKIITTFGINFTKDPKHIKISLLRNGIGYKLMDSMIQFIIAISANQTN